MIRKASVPMDVSFRCNTSGLLRDALGGVVEERFFSDAVAFPALVGEFLHLGDGSIQPFEAKDPADDHLVAIHEHRPDTLR